MPETKTGKGSIVIRASMQDGKFAPSEETLKKLRSTILKEVEKQMKGQPADNAWPYELPTK